MIEQYQLGHVKIYKTIIKELEHLLKTNRAVLKCQIYFSWQHNHY